MSHAPLPSPSWPDLPADSWTDTRATLHRWLQIVGKTRLALCPMLNQWWQVALIVTPRGLSTGPMPYAGGLCELVFDFWAHRLRLHTSDGRPPRELALAPRSVADFYQHYRVLLREAGIAVKLWPVPVELADATPFAADQHHRAYDAAAVGKWWQIMLSVSQLLEEFRAQFTGKGSPVGFFWGGFDLSVTRFSGRAAPPHGPVPHLGQRVTDLAYNEELSEAGWWPGGEGQPAAFFAYAYPSPAGYEQAPRRPAAATFNSELGEFVLPYEAVRTSAAPEQAVREFLRATYEAAANLAHWDRPALERTNQFPLAVA